MSWARCVASSPMPSSICAIQVLRTVARQGVAFAPAIADHRATSDTELLWPRGQSSLPPHPSKAPSSTKRAATSSG
eukprot:7112575-Lingulodinium_polyedra.AAC.1